MDATCSMCGHSRPQRVSMVRAAAGLVLMLRACGREGKKLPVIVPEGCWLEKHFEVASGFVDDELRRPAEPGLAQELAETCLRAWKDRSGAEAWAACLLHLAGVPETGLGYEQAVPVLSSPLRVLR